MNDTSALTLGEGARISPTRATTNIRGGGYGSGAWVASITGTDPKFGLRRKFINANRSGLSGSGRSGSISWEIDQAVVLLEWRDFCVGFTARNWRSSGYALIAAGAVRRIDRDEALKFAALLDPQVSGSSAAKTAGLLLTGGFARSADELRTAVNTVVSEAAPA